MQFEVAVGMNGRVWVRARTVKETICLGIYFSHSDFIQGYPQRMGLYRQCTWFILSVSLYLCCLFPYMYAVCFLVFMLSVSLYLCCLFPYICDSLQLYFFLPFHWISHKKIIIKAEDLAYPRNRYSWRDSARLHSIILCGWLCIPFLFSWIKNGRV